MKLILGVIAAILAVFVLGGLAIDLLDHSIHFLFHEALGVGAGVAIGGGYMKVRHYRAIEADNRRRELSA